LAAVQEREREALIRLEQVRQQAQLRAEQIEEQLRRAEERAQEAERRAHDLQQRAHDAEQHTIVVERRLHEVEQRAREAEWMVRQLQAETNVTMQQSKEEPHWLVQRREIGLTEEEIGRGGWAIVKVANFRGIRVAAKCFYQQILVSPYNRQLYDREMNMAARLRHPNLVQFIGASLERETIILIELMSTSLRAELERGPIEHACITSISLDVARALNYLHLMQPHPIIHRDISSANVLLDPLPNNQWRAKVSDYGSVNLLRELRTVGPGCPVYAAPEASVPANQSPKMDIFSFGVLLVEMLTNKFPAVDARQNLIDSINHAEFVDLIGNCLREEKEERPSADEIITKICSN
jgi:serine/threonine protein kinase